MKKQLIKEWWFLAILVIIFLFAFVALIQTRDGVNKEEAFAMCDYLNAVENLTNSQANLLCLYGDNYCRELLINTDCSKYK